MHKVSRLVRQAAPRHPQMLQALRRYVRSFDLVRVRVRVSLTLTLTLTPTVTVTLTRYRAAFLYELPADGHPVEGGAVCAIMADVSRRFTPHLAAWRAAAGAAAGAPGGAPGGEAVAVARAVGLGRARWNGSEPWPLAGRGEGGQGGKGGMGGRGRPRARGKGKGKGRGKRELKQRQLKRAERAAAGLRQAHAASGRPLSELYGTR